MKNPQVEQYLLALDIAIKAHCDQVDKGGNPYIHHPLYIASQMPFLDLRTIALLHDVLEDSDYTREDLIKEGLREDIVSVVEVLTRKEDETYMEYIERVSKNRIAKIVKIEDLKHNMDTSRMNGREISESLLERYKKALEYLER